MTAASLGWAAWWVTLVMWRFAPSIAPSSAWASVLGSGFAMIGILLALVALRAGRAWILFTIVALFANGSLLLLPWILPGLHS